jgi:hypothetical protein
MSTTPQALSFDDLGAKPVSTAPASGSLDFSDLGAKQVSSAPSQSSELNTVAEQQPLTNRAEGTTRRRIQAAGLLDCLLPLQNRKLQTVRFRSLEAFL